eukprot:13191535-Alexandrium_andersonii.AAC.1
MEAPDGCRLRQYVDMRGRSYWKAVLPKGQLYQGQNSRSAGYGEALRSEQAAKDSLPKARAWNPSCRSWMQAPQ